MDHSTTPTSNERGEENRELWTIDQVTEFLGASSTGSARRTLSRWGVEAAVYRRGANNRVQAVYDAEQIRSTAKARPGRGARTDLKKDTPKP